MKLLVVLMLCAIAAAAPKADQVAPASIGPVQEQSVEERNIIINALIRQLVAYIRRIINNGSAAFGIPPLDPLELESYHLELPAGLINLDLNLRDIYVAGIGGFVDNRLQLNLRDLTFDVDISVPTIDIRAGEYDLLGDLFNAIPLYGKGPAHFYVTGFRLRAKLFLKQSDDLESILIDRIEDASFEIPSIKSDLSGVIGGGDIDKIVNAMIEDVVFDYVNRFQGAISIIASNVIVGILNPVLDQLNTWSFIAPFVPRG